ncbi:pyridoxamine 5'-phosphate oxidase family protein [Brevibacillus sp. TJ4]|uniref:pyridoxamine 5'-phosphate oxidase family protein n=1 Tax=Brevibacillus sp. TJ4 TaxID=3234853 RepID=UPI0037D6ABD3
MSDFGIFRDVITAPEELKEMFGEPSEVVQKKAIDHLDEHCRRYLSQAPFLILATSDANGRCDASPRGDAPGFVHVIDDRHLVIPERPGNRRMDSIRNILSNPHVGLIFLIPSLQETLRINGRACIIRDAHLLEKMEVNGKVPTIGIGVQVEECFVHCAKAFIRSGLWQPDKWMTKEELPDMPKMLAEHIKMPGVGAKEIAEGLQESYKKNLY